MDKEKIISKYKLAGHDEYNEHIDHVSKDYAYEITSFVIVVIILIKQFMGQSNSDTFAILWTYLGLHSYKRYILTKEKRDRNLSILHLLLALAFFARFFYVIFW